MNSSQQSPHLETKALYNTLAMLHQNEQVPKGDLWKVQDMRTCSLEALFGELRRLRVNFDQKQFYHWAAACETPEELLELVLGEEEEKSEQADHIYLILFELWRRLAPEKRSLSIIADDIDHCIDAFDREEEVEDAQVESLLSEWGRLLDSLRDTGLTEDQALRTIEPFFAHDVPDFVIDYLLEVTGRQEASFTSLLLEKMRSHCMRESLWLKFIELKLSLHEEDLIDVRKKLGELASSVLTSRECDVELTLALCDIAFELKKDELLVRLLEKLLPCLEEDDDFEAVLEFLRLSAERKGSPSLVARAKNMQKSIRNHSAGYEEEMRSLVQAAGELL